MLNLNDDLVVAQLGTTKDKLLLGMSNKAQAYEYSNTLGTWARQKGYNGIIFPGARGNFENGFMFEYKNILIFNQSTLDLVLNGKIPIKLK